MAGHSHWANIQHKKGITDAKRGRLWSKLSRAIIIAARNGGGDPVMNLKLRYAIDKARAVSMPKDNIERAIKRGIGETDGQTFDEINYEGFGPAGIAILVDILTDNRARTNGEVRKIFERGGGNMGGAGCVGYLFERKGIITIDASLADEDALLDMILDAGAEDLRRVDGVFEIRCEPGDFSAVQEALAKGKIVPNSADVTSLAKTTVDAPDIETALKVLKLVENIDDHDDVQNVYHNMNMTDEIIAAASK
ncbi:MAG: YebC/PmpR family DNA-binding transcriptional regulator [Planctomycetia bacterium]|nr:YebC/PmpR family DNA-binding transcriptional regulator [Planctomycetia bacterium]